MIVDDEPDIGLAFESVLDGSGFKVDSFNDPLLALKNFKANAYFLLILDIKMPKMNGFEFYLEIKKIDNKVKLCFLTALSEFQDYQAFKKEMSPKEGKRYFIAKPTENREVLERVNTIVLN